MAITVSPKRSYPSTASNAALNSVLRLAFRCLTAYKLVACAATCVVRKLFLPPIEWCCDACLTYMSRITPHAYWIIIYVQIACLNLLCVNTAIGMTNMYVSVVSDDLQWGMPICVGECSVIDFATAASRRSSRCNMSDAVLPLPHTAKTSRARYRRFFFCRCQVRLFILFSEAFVGWTECFCCWAPGFCVYFVFFDKLSRRLGLLFIAVDYADQCERR